MIKSKKDLQYYLDKDKKYYLEGTTKDYVKKILYNDHLIPIYKYIKMLRKVEYYYNNTDTNINKLLYVYYNRKKNMLGNKLGFSMGHNCFGDGLTIFHHGNIIINGCAKIGKNCKLHGDNCIGNNGFNNKNPILGDNIDIGVGAKIIGDIFLANNIIIGANAVVVNSFYEEGITIAGVPAKRVK